MEIKGMFACGLEYEGQRHKSFTLRLPTLADVEKAIKAAQNEAWAKSGRLPHGQTRDAERAQDGRKANKKWDTVFAGIPLIFFGAPGRNRTCGLLLRRQSLYPTELRARVVSCKAV